LQPNTKYFISIDRLDRLPGFLLSNYKSRCNIPYPDKEDRKLILGQEYIAAEKYLQGKTFKEIKNLIKKVS
jgi:hypothetical protein